MEHTQLQIHARAFLAAYESKNLQAISHQMTDDVVIRDWNLEVVGKVNALQEFAKNFLAANSLSIQIIQLHTSDFGVAAEIEIEVNGVETLRVVDVFNFDDDGKITSIISYKGL